MAKKNDFALGIACCIIAAVLWGSTGVAGQYLINGRGVDNTWLTTFRTFVGGGLLVLWTIITKKGAAFDIWRNKHDAIHLVIYGAIGVAACYWTYLEAVSLSNAPTATVLQYLSPIIIVVYMAVRNRKMPSVQELVGVVCAVTGVFAMATHFDFGSLSISPAALVIGITSAFCLAFYGVYPKDLIRKYGAVYVYGWAVFVGGIVMMFVRPLWQVPTEAFATMDLPLAAVLAFVLFFGTMFAYSIYLVGVDKIGPSRGSMISSIEPVATAFLAAVLLSTPLELLDWVGVGLITVTVIVLSIPSKADREAQTAE